MRPWFMTEKAVIILMGIAGAYFLTPHAVEQFRNRMAWRMSYEDALAAIIKGIAEHGEEPTPALNDSGAYIIRVKKGPFRFRAVVDPRRREGDKSAVVSILYGKSGGRKHWKEVKE
jgi:hypothetical protein